MAWVNHANRSIQELRIFALLLAVFLEVLIFQLTVDPTLRAQLSLLLIPLFLGGLFLPSCFRVPLNIWMRLSSILGMIFAPLTLGIVYFFVLSPTSIILKFIFGRDLLSVQEQTSCWCPSDECNSQEFFERMY